MGLIFRMWYNFEIVYLVCVGLTVCKSVCITRDWFVAKELSIEWHRLFNYCM